MFALKDIVLIVASLAIGVLANFIWHLTADWWVQILRGVLLARFKPYGLTGIWLSTYWYSSGESDDIRQSKHLIVCRWGVALWAKAFRRLMALKFG